MQEYNTDLSQDHLKRYIEGSGIALDVAQERAYRTSTGLSELKSCGITVPRGADVHGLLLPLHTVEGTPGTAYLLKEDRSVSLVVYRFDTAPIGADGSELRYLYPANQRQRLDCPPRCQPLLNNPAVTLWVTEGQRKADALASHGLCALDVLGVENWRILGDWHHVALAGRDVRIVHDSDWLTNKNVKRALYALRDFLRSQGARVSIVSLPSPDGRKVGIDDFLLDHTLADLEQLCRVPRSPQPQGEQPPGPQAGHCWTQGQTAADFLAQDDQEVLADAQDLVVPGCISVVAAPRASGKSIVVLCLAVSLAQGGVFRGERVPQRRVALIDRDNPPSLVRKRLRALGAQAVTTLTVFTRDKAAPLTDAAAWAAFPVEQFDVIMVDSIGAATEGVSEKEGKQTQQYLATLKDLAQRGPAILCLDNTNKAAQNYRGRGEKGDAVDILYEARNITGWMPTHGGDWWEDLPDCGEHTWQQRASRRKGQPVMQIAFIPSKFRLAIEPEPFVLAIDTSQDPWTLDDITEDIATAGQRAADETARLERAKIMAAETALCYALGTRDRAQPMLKREAENFLCAQGLRQKVARTLLSSGGNHDLYPAGRWILREIPGARGNPVAVYLVGEEDHNQNNTNHKSPNLNATPGPSISVDGSMPQNQNALPTKPAETLGENGVAFWFPPGYTSTEINFSPTKENGWCSGVGIISVGDPHSSGVEEPCLHEHVNTLGVCNDCGLLLEERMRDQSQQGEPDGWRRVRSLSVPIAWWVSGHSA